MKPLLLMSFVITLLMWSPAAFAGEETDRIVFLNLTLEGDEARLDDVKVVDGTLKQRRRLRLAPHHLYYVVTSTSGEKLYEGALHNPSILRVEYEDPFGNLRMKKASRSVTNFSIRIPYDANAHRVTIHKIEAAVPEDGRIAEQTEMIGSFVIDLRGGTDEK